jgi:hypothetical protein
METREHVGKRKLLEMKDHKGGWTAFYTIRSSEERAEGQCIAAVHTVPKVPHFALGTFTVWAADGEEWLRFTTLNGVASTTMSKVAWGVGRTGQGLSVGVQIPAATHAPAATAAERVQAQYRPPLAAPGFSRFSADGAPR